MCCVCFDGESTDTNPIVFCDGCNIAIHKACYGIQAIPDGDFFCEKCKFTRRHRDAKVSCVMCPFEDGAMKQTTNQGWIHVVCAIWYPGTWITNLSAMGPVDVQPNAVSRGLKAFAQSRNAARAPMPEELRSTGPPRLMDAVTAPTTATAPATAATPTVAGAPGITTAAAVGLGSPSTSNGGDSAPTQQVKSVLGAETCSVCKSTHGQTLQCTYPGCTTSFHPLCAWYDGAYMRASRARGGGAEYVGGGVIPGSLHLRCMRHVPRKAVQAQRSAHAQGTIRQKYRVTAGDQEEAETAAKRRRERRRKRKQRDAGVSSAKGDAHEPRRRVLAGDAYMDGVCAVCFDSASAVNQTDRNDLVVCDTCRITVHKVRCVLCVCVRACMCSLHGCDGCETEQACYGATIVPGATSWTCDVCAAGVKDAACVLCPRSGGAFKATSSKGKLNGKWVHLFCALMMPGVHFDDPDHMTGIDVRGVHKEVCMVAVARRSCRRRRSLAHRRLPWVRSDSGWCATCATRRPPRPALACSACSPTATRHSTACVRRCPTATRTGWRAAREVRLCAARIARPTTLPASSGARTRSAGSACRTHKICLMNCSCCSSCGATWRRLVWYVVPRVAVHAGVRFWC